MRRYLVTVVLLSLLPGLAVRADAQPPDAWDVSVIPYFWPTRVDGDMAAGPRTVPVFLTFADAADNLAGAFSFHAEAAKGRWGVLTDLSFIRLSSSAPFTILNRPIEGEFKLDNLTFELGGSYLLNPAARIGVIGGLRTYTMAPRLEFRGTNSQATPIDTSQTSANAFVGITVRPRLAERWTFIGRGDVGGGNADFTWSALVGLEFRVASWGGVEFGYKALGIHVTTDDEDRIVSEYDMTHYGPIFGFRLHWGTP
jgi:hypothetical protein